MRFINVLLSILVSLLIGALVLEGGLRLIGKGPDKSLLGYDAVTGWSNVPGRTKTLHKGPITVHYAINGLGLRDDPLPAEKGDAYRILALGDSFTLGFAVEREDHFVDLLEQSLRAEGRPVEVWNAGAEGWDTAQQAAWLEAHGKDIQPDLVLLLPYENDLYWNTQESYATLDGPRAKPRYGAGGVKEGGEIPEPAPKPWHQRLALTKWLGKKDFAGLEAHKFTPPGASRKIDKELAPTLANGGGLDAEIDARTGAALDAIQRTTGQLGAQLVVAPIPSAAKYVDAWTKIYETGRGLGSMAWSPDRPVETFLRLATERGIPTLDARPALDAAKAEGQTLYWEADWHLDPSGSAVLAEALRTGLEAQADLPAASTDAAQLASLEPKQAGMPFALKLYLGLWVLLSGLYLGTYKDEPKWLPPIKVGVLLAAVFAIFIGIGKLQGALPSPWGRYLPLLFLIAILGFVVYKLGSRIGTITELIGAFIMRGHWYLMPLVVVLLSIGSLLVVAASSPLVAPFIYTLF